MDPIKPTPSEPDGQMQNGQIMDVQAPVAAPSNPAEKSDDIPAVEPMPASQEAAPDTEQDVDKTAEAEQADNKDANNTQEADKKNDKQEKTIDPTQQKKPIGPMIAIIMAVVVMIVLVGVAVFAYMQQQAQDSTLQPANQSEASQEAAPATEQDVIQTTEELDATVEELDKSVDDSELSDENLEL